MNEQWLGPGSEVYEANPGTPIFRSMVATSTIERNKVEVERLHRIRMSTNKFRKAARAAGYQITDEKLYFIRPVFKMKFGLHPISADIVRPFPGIRDVVALEAGYILKNI